MVDFPSNLVLISGAAGWLGKALTQALARGLPDVPRLAKPTGSLTIRCFVRRGENTSFLRSLPGRIEVVEGDLRQPSDCAAFCLGMEGATLFHTAGIIHPRKTREFFEINTGGTINLLDAAIDARVRRAVVVSSNSPCGCNPHQDHLFDENSPYHPYMGYGRSKMLLEQKALERRDRIGIVIIRPPWFYGPHQPPRQTEFFRMVRDGKMPLVGNGQNRRSMAYIDNLAQGLILAALTEKASGKTYWIADARPYAMTEIIDTVERLLETEFGQKCVHRRLRLPGVVGDIATVVDASLQAFGLYHQKIHVLSEMNKTIACSIERARAELGYSPAISLKEGMRRSIRWCIEAGQTI